MGQVGQQLLPNGLFDIWQEAQWLKNPPAKAGDSETQVQSLGWEDPLEKETTTHSSILAWRIPWTKEPGGLQSMGSQRVGHDLVHTHTHSSLTNIS